MIVDEEQRFGVAQKELLRQLRLEVDVLALSATPIPRTLHMSLAGLRDISVIETPPEGRRPIRTFVGEYDDELIAQALEPRGRAQRAGVLPAQPRRDDRGGGRRSCSSSAPISASSSRTARCAERELEDQMIKFLAGDADVLVSTTIIESGLDIPQANTLIVERADQLGLSQLYQIRGRVGRSDVLAHAYLFYPDARELTPRGARAARDARRPHRARRRLRDRDARPRDPRRRRPARRRAVGPRRRARLRALRRDAARGRRRALRAAARSRRGRYASTRASTRTSRPRYIAAEALKIDLHRRIALTETEDELHELRVATEDRYGPLPGAGREPVRDPGGEAEARASRRRLPRLPRRPRDGRAGRPRLGRAARAAVAVETAVYSTGNREVTLRGERIQGSARFGRCYAGRAPGGLAGAFL